MSTVRAVLAKAARRLAAAGVADAEREAGWLLAHAAGTTVGVLKAMEYREAAPEVLAAFWPLVERRAAREPVQYILGTQEFCGLTLKVTPDVLIPRPDTEVLVEQAVARLAGPVRVADIGTGSGAIAVAVAKGLPAARVVAVDISPAALAVARENARDHGVADRIEFRQGDLLDPLGTERFDAVLCNPPYIAASEWETLMPEVRLYEPKVALTPGADGLLFYRRLAAEAPARLKPGGLLAVEVGIGQAPAVVALFQDAGLAVQVCRDPAGVERVVMGTG